MLEVLARIRVEFSAVRNRDSLVHAHFRDRLEALAVSALLVDALGTVLFFLFEHGQAGTGISNLGDSLFFVTTQMTSLGSPLPNPISTAGRVVDVGLEIYAITAGAALAGAFGSFFVHRTRDREAAQATPQTPS